MAVASDDGGQAPVKVTAEQLGLAPADPLEEQLEFDLGNLAAFDPSPVDAAAFAPARRSAACLEAAAAMAQALVSKLFSLPSEPVTGGRLARLPPPATPLPREKPLPKAKPMTKWQQFAQKKGIVKRKRSKLAWDDDANEWKRRHGYKKANDDAAVPIIEAKPGDEVGDDPFTRLRQEKRERVKKNQQQQLANLKGATKGGARLPPTLRLAAALPEKGRGKPVKRKELKDEIKGASRLAGVSTASQGKFDRRLPGEKDGERSLQLGRRRKFLAVADTAAERRQVAGVADRLLRERADDIIDINKAIGKFEAAARDDRHLCKASGKKGGKGGGKGGAPKAKGGVGKKGGGGKGGGGKGGGGKGGNRKAPDGRGGGGGGGGKRGGKGGGKRR